MSEERKWTAGPWTASGGGYQDWKKDGFMGVITAQNGQKIFAGPSSFNALQGATKAECNANARLIAAAPCLYEALDEMITWWVEDANATDPRLGHQVACDPRVQNAVDALKRAQGGEP